MTEQLEDQETDPGPPLPSVDRVNAMMGRWHRLDAEIAEYDRLHEAEIERLNLRREKAIGRVQRRVDRIRRAVEQYAVASYLHFGSKAVHLPNGDIESRPVVPAIDKDDEAVGKWMVMIPELDKAWELRRWVDMKKLRAWLDERVATGDLQRLVIWEGIDGPEFELVDENVGWHSEFPEGWTGVWFWTETGAEKYDTVGGPVNEGEMLPGVTWSPKGTFGSGRNFKVKL